MDLLTLPTRVWSVGAQMAETLFDGGKRHAQVALMQATYDAAVENYRQTVLTGLQQVEGLTNYLQVITAQTNLLQNQRAAVDIFTRRMVASVLLEPGPGRRVGRIALAVRNRHAPMIEPRQAALSVLRRLLDLVRRARATHSDCPAATRQVTLTVRVV